MGAENMFVFGLRADAVTRLKTLGYDARLYVEENLPLRAVLEAIGSGAFSPGEADRYRALVDALLHHDTYMLMADFADYWPRSRASMRCTVTPAPGPARAAQRRGHGPFSADRTIGEYVAKVWTPQARRAEPTQRAWSLRC